MKLYFSEPQAPVVGRPLGWEHIPGSHGSAQKCAIKFLLAQLFLQVGGRMDVESMTQRSRRLDGPKV